MLAQSLILVTLLDMKSDLDKNLRATHYPAPSMHAGNVSGDPDRMVCLPLDQLGEILRHHLLKQQNVKILFNYRVTTIGQDENKAWVQAETPDRVKKLSADYIVGCNGANSQIRLSVFGDLVFPGRTWDEQIVATNVYYGFGKFQWNDSNFIVHPEHWFMAAKITKDGLWRVTYGELSGLTNAWKVQRHAAGPSKSI
ncbi:hypothetical protein ACJ41O_000126 [Fusarium nematophilum]